jgi:hypothetical protein
MILQLQDTLGRFVGALGNVRAVRVLWRLFNGSC